MQNIQIIACIPNVIAIVLLMVLVLSTQKAMKYSVTGDKIFRIMVICNLIQCICEILAYCMDGRNGMLITILLKADNSFLFINNIVFAYLWTIYTDYKIFEDKKRIWNRAKLVILPGILVTIGSIVNLFCPVFYEISDQNKYERTGLYIVPYIITYFYLIYGVGLTYKYKSNAKKYMFMPAIIFMIPIFIGSVVQFYAYGMSFIWIGTAIALVSLYVNVQNETSFIDALSGLYTRAYMYQYIRSEIENPTQNAYLVGVMLDIDHFKEINDSYGHITGDHAISNTGMLLRKSVGNKGIAVRYAGDEFIILQYISDIEEINETIQKIEKIVEKFNQSGKTQYQLNFSKGFDVFRVDTDTMDTFLRRIDTFMYQEKKSKKAQEM